MDKHMNCPCFFYVSSVPGGAVQMCYVLESYVSIKKISDFEIPENNLTKFSGKGVKYF